MLVLSRNTGEVLCVGDDVKITVLSVKGSQVRFGINAPTEVRVDRAEVRRRIEQQATKPN
jgi:carbon storage regulator